MISRTIVFDKLDSPNIICSPPKEVLDALSVLDIERPTTMELSNLILNDSELAARILRMANAIYNRSKQDIAEVNQAIEVIGRGKVKALLLPVTIYNIILACDTGNPATIERLWEHMLETAAAAQNTARITGYCEENLAFMAGFFHDLGRIFLALYFPEEFDEICRIAREDKILIYIERDILGTDHQEVGRFIAERWGLPKSLSEVMGNHHPDDISCLDTYGKLTRMVVFADNFLSAGLDLSDGPTEAALKASVLENCSATIGFSLEDLKNICSDLPGDILAIADLFYAINEDRSEHLSRINRKLFDSCLYLAGGIREERELSGTVPLKNSPGGIDESLNGALATFSHQINNATMNISGQCEILQMLHERNDRELIHRKLPAAIESVKSSIRKISLILEELPGLRNVEYKSNNEKSKADDIKPEPKNRYDSTQVPA